MDEPIPIEGIVEGDPEALAAVCAAGGSAVLAYCAAVGARTYLAETVVAALGDFRRGVVANADQEPSHLQDLLVSVTESAVRQVAGVISSPAQQTAGQAALEGAVTGPLAPGLAPRIIGALVLAAPVTALGGDPSAIRRAAEERYVRMFDARVAPAPVPAPTPRPAPAPAAPPAVPPAPRTPAGASAAAWLPPEIAGLDGPAAAAPDATSDALWSAPAEPTAPALPDAPPPPAPAPALMQPEPEPDPDPRPAPPATPPIAKPPPGALVIKRGGHWPFKRRPRRTSHGPRLAGSTWRVVGAAVAGLAVGAGVAALAAPQKVVRPDAILVRPRDVPFTVDRAVFNVARTGTSLWALQIRRQQPRSGRSWLTLAVQTRNVSRPNFHPRGLGFRLRTPAGVAIGPDTALIAGVIPAVGGRLPTGKRTSVHLGFQVPTAQRGLTLEFDPSLRGPTIRVPLD